MTYTVSRIISDETLSCIIQIESGGKAKAKAPTSSAGGLGQFIDSTWIVTISKYRPDLTKGKSRADILALKYEPKIAIEMLARFTEENAKALGPGYTDGDLYLAHFAGVGTAKRLKSAARSTACSAVFTQAAINANRSILSGKTCGEVRDWAARKMASAGGKGWVAKWLGNAPAIAPKPAEPVKEASKEGGKQGLIALIVAGIVTAIAWLAQHPVIAIFGTAALVACGVFAWRWYQSYRASKAGEAAVVAALAEPPLKSKRAPATRKTPAKRNAATKKKKPAARKRAA